jgi:hypothetical protein
MEEGQYETTNYPSKDLKIEKPWMAKWPLSVYSVFKRSTSDAEGTISWDSFFKEFFNP